MDNLAQKSRLVERTIAIPYLASLSKSLEYAILESIMPQGLSSVTKKEALELAFSSYPDFRYFFNEKSLDGVSFKKDGDSLIVTDAQRKLYAETSEAITAYESCLGKSEEEINSMIEVERGNVYPWIEVVYGYLFALRALRYEIERPFIKPMLYCSLPDVTKTIDECRIRLYRFFNTTDRMIKNPVIAERLSSCMENGVLNPSLTTAERAVSLFPFDIELLYRALDGESSIISEPIEQAEEASKDDEPIEIPEPLDLIAFSEENASPQANDEPTAILTDDNVESKEPEEHIEIIDSQEGERLANLLLDSAKVIPGNFLDVSIYRYGCNKDAFPASTEEVGRHFGFSRARASQITIMVTNKIADPDSPCYIAYQELYSQFLNLKSPEGFLHEDKLEEFLGDEKALELAKLYSQILSKEGEWLNYSHKVKAFFAGDLDQALKQGFTGYDDIMTSQRMDALDKSTKQILISSNIYQYRNGIYIRRDSRYLRSLRSSRDSSTLPGDLYEKIIAFMAELPPLVYYFSIFKTFIGELRDIGITDLKTLRNSFNQADDKYDHYSEYAVLKGYEIGYQGAMIESAKEFGGAFNLDDMRTRFPYIDDRTFLDVLGDNPDFVSLGQGRFLYCENYKDKDAELAEAKSFILYYLDFNHIDYISANKIYDRLKRKKPELLEGLECVDDGESLCGIVGRFLADDFDAKKNQIARKGKLAADRNEMITRFMEEKGGVINRDDIDRHLTNAGFDVGIPHFYYDVVLPNKDKFMRVSKDALMSKEYLALPDEFLTAFFAKLNTFIFISGSWDSRNFAHYSSFPEADKFKFDKFSTSGLVLSYGSDLYEVEVVGNDYRTQEFIIRRKTNG